MSFRPLPKDLKRSGSIKAGNLGLFYNKFFDGWTRQEGDVKLADGAKTDWIRRFAGKTSERSGPAAAAYAARIEALAKARGGVVGHFETIAPFVTGIGIDHPVENGFLWHHTLGLPYLPGSSVKGMLRRWVENWADVSGNNDPDEIARKVNELFGAPEGGAPAQGALIVFDAVPTGGVELMVEVLTPHDGGWRLDGKTWPADWLDPVPIPFLAVAPGAKFQFAIAPVRQGSRADAATAMAHLSEHGADGTARHRGADAATAMAHLSEALDWIGAGAKTASGFGRFTQVETPWRVGDEAILPVGDNIVVIITAIPASGNPVLVNKADPTKKYTTTRLENLRRPAP